MVVRSSCAGNGKHAGFVSDQIVPAFDEQTRSRLAETPDKKVEAVSATGRLTPTLGTGSSRPIPLTGSLCFLPESVGIWPGRRCDHAFLQRGG